MTYTQYTIRKQKPLMTLYRCGGCDKPVLQIVVLRVNAFYNDKGTFTRRGVEKRAARAEAMGNDAMEERLYELKLGRNTDVFKKAQLKCTCPHCGRREPWARMNVNWMETIAMVAGFIALACYVVLKLPQAAMAALAVALGFVALRFGWLAYLKSRVDAQMVKCPPLFDDDMQKLQERSMKYQAYENVDWAVLQQEMLNDMAEHGVS